jgi:hypothetical protein
MTIMKKKICIYCHQIDDGTMEGFMKVEPCNAPDGDGHSWFYNKAYKRSFTEKFPFQYFVIVKSYTAKTIDENKWNTLQSHLEEQDLFDFNLYMITQLEIAGFTIVKNYGG